MSEWDPQAIEQAIDLEMHGEMTEHGDVIQKTPTIVAQQTAKDTVAFAMKRIAWIACYSENESRALDASKYIVDRIFGKVTDTPLPTGDVEDALRELTEAAYSRTK